MKSPKTLTIDIAKRFIESPDSVNLQDFEIIEDEAAEVLATNKSTLHLDGLTLLSVGAAKALAQHKGDWLSLNGLTSLSEDVAVALARQQYNRDWWLTLNGLTFLSNSVAEALVKVDDAVQLSSDTVLEFDGLTYLPEETAKILAKHNGPLMLDGLTSLSEELAKTLALHKGQVLMLNGLTELSEKAAKALAQYKGVRLNLSGLTALSKEAAEALAQYRGRSLEMLKLANISTDAAKALAQYKGDWLDLEGLTSLSAEAAKALVQCKGFIFCHSIHDSEILEFIQTSQWRFAKTMPQWPHEYVVREWRPDKDSVFERLVMKIRERGYNEKFGKTTYRYLAVDGWKYWTMGESVNETIIINRARVKQE